MKVNKMIDQQNEKRMTKNEKLRQRYRRIFFIVLLASSFFAGYSIGGNDQWWEGYRLGEDAMASHIRNVIRDKMKNPEMSPFYLADIGIYFTPRGDKIVTLRFLDTGEPAARVAGLEKKREGP